MFVFKNLKMNVTKTGKHIEGQAIIIFTFHDMSGYQVDVSMRGTTLLLHMFDCWF
jgi:hypothetical protein